jgi:hypothetical protein
MAVRLKSLLSNFILAEQFCFLERRQIHEAVGIAQEGLHTIKISKSSDVVVKIDLSKAYDRVCWLYLRLLLTHICFSDVVVKWIIACVFLVSFAVLINGATFELFKLSRGSRQGCPLSPYLFLLVDEGLSRSLANARRRRSLQGIKVGS